MLAAAIPVVIHLINRRHAQILPIATLRFLRQIPARTIRRRRVEEYILLAARMLLLALLAIGAARPVITDATASGGATAAVVVLDDSWSLEYRVGGITRYQEAIEAALKVVRTLAPGDRAAVIAASRPSGVTLGSDLDAMQRRIGASSPSPLARDLLAPVEKALELLREAPEPNRELTIITDLQARAVMPLVERLAVGAEDREIRITAIDVGATKPVNAGVAAVRTGAGVAIAGEPIRVSATVRNTSAAPLKTRATLVLGAERVAESKVTVAAKTSVTVSFSITSEIPGAIGGQVAIESDNLMKDDARHFALPVMGRIPVLLVDGDPSPIRYQDEAFFLQAALAPEDLGAEKIRSPVHLRIIEPTEFSEEDLTPYRVIILANVPSLPSRDVTALRAFVRGGAGLLIFCGNRVDANAMNRDFGADPEDGILPAALAPPIQLGSTAEAVVPLGDADHRHPLFADLPPKALKDLTRIHVKRAMQADARVAGGTVVAKLENGTPLIVEKEAGRGRVLLVTTSADADWGNLPLRPLFLPLLHRAVKMLAGGGNTANSYLVGDVASIPAPGPTGPPPEILDPTGDLRRLVGEPGADGGLSYGPLLTPGLYRVTGSGTGEEFTFSVNVDPDEGDLTRADPELLTDLFRGGRFRILTDVSGLEALLTHSREGKPIAGFFLLAALLLLLFEGFFANRIATARAEKNAGKEELG